MSLFLRLVASELIKLRRSGALRLVWLLPVFFIALEFTFFERPVLSVSSGSAQLSDSFNYIQIKMVGLVWAGLFHPLMVAMLPALVFRPEHRFSLWRHLQAMPVPRRSIHIAKILIVFVLCAASLGIVGFGLWLERMLLAWVNPALAFPFHFYPMVALMGWLFLGSVPVVAIYIWVSDRINSLAVPVVFGLIGVLLNISLSGAEVPQAWKRDLIPWVLPYSCAQSAIDHHTPRQSAHLAGKMFQEEPNVLRLPSGRKIKTRQNIPDEVLFPPPPPTPKRTLALFSLVLGAILIGTGLFDSARNRL